MVGAQGVSHEGVICIEKIAGVERRAPARYVQRIPGLHLLPAAGRQRGPDRGGGQGEGPRGPKVGRFPFIGNGKAIALGEPEGMVKTVFDAKTGELLGAHMVGAEVTELIQGYVVAMSVGDHRSRPDAHRLPAPDPVRNDARVGA